MSRWWERKKKKGRKEGRKGEREGGREEGRGKKKPPVGFKLVKPVLLVFLTTAG